MNTLFRGVTITGAAVVTVLAGAGLASADTVTNTVGGPGRIVVTTRSTVDVGCEATITDPKGAAGPRNYQARAAEPGSTAFTGLPAGSYTVRTVCSDGTPTVVSSSKDTVNVTQPTLLDQMMQMFGS
ncbi:hypothetical protein GCM10023094_41270 [Rhodococcus olei]|uniref:Carboxypeptidase family protein n=1 Tax=Rhodococcus olei TaxID=2161675 RepID=A0ABP8PFL3_9NOCA